MVTYSLMSCEVGFDFFIHSNLLIYVMSQFLKIYHNEIVISLSFQTDKAHQTV